jgi:CheY-like chemotaxis protein
MDVQPGPVDVRALCEGLLESFRPVAEQKQLKFEVNADSGLSRPVLTDEQRLRQILRNLLSNAFKFTDSGRVTLVASLPTPAQRAALGPSATNEDLIAFSVTDTGVGVAPDKLAQIFEAFQQADGTTSRRYGGTGLGLSISRQIAHLLGGTITVESEPGSGSTFTLVLPCQLLSVETPVSEEFEDHPVRERTGRGPIITAPSLADEGGTVPDHGLQDRTILVVDDDIRNVFALTSALELHGATVLYADNGAQGLEIVKAHPEIDLILMDVMMPGMDGNETTTAIRGIPGRTKLPILFLTAKAMAGDREKSFAAGASDYITKPVNLDELVISMRRLLAVGGTEGDTAPGF